MVHDKIAIILKDLGVVREKLKDVKKDMKQEEHLDEAQYLELKKALKDLKAQVKEREEEHAEDLKKDDFYNQLRELRMKHEEELANLSEKLFGLLSDLPPKAFEIKMETENGSVRVQVIPEMTLYMNGKEEKKRF